MEIGVYGRLASMEGPRVVDKRSIMTIVEQITRQRALATNGRRHASARWTRHLITWSPDHLVT